MAVEELVGRPTLKQLSVFSSVAATGSANAASNKLLISQPGASYALDQLEATLQVRLFDRTRSGSFLTPEGKLFQTRTERCLSQYVAAIGDIVASSERIPDRAEATFRKLRDNQVKALVAIWRMGTFRAAAMSLGITESSLHEPARELEKLLRTTLYRRSAKGIEVNETGAELARRISVAQAEMRSAIEEIGSKPLEAATNLRVGILALSPRRIIAETTLELLTSLPQPKIQIVEATYAQHIEALRAGDIDVIFSMLRNKAEFDDLVEERLFEDPYVLACGAQHPLAKLKTVTPQQIANYDLVLPPEGFPRRSAVDQALARWRISKKRHVETSCFETTLALLTESNCVSMLSKWHIDTTGSRLRRIDLKGPKMQHRFMGLTMRKDWLPTTLQAEFVRIIRQKTKPTHKKIKAPARATA